MAALYQNCLKLASENKITSKNTWALPLIDHLADLVAPAAGSTGGTDFQRASLTLAAGVSIYAHRVDAVHGDVFKILGGLGRANGGDEEEAGDGQEAAADGDGEARPAAARRRRRDADPSSTLEPAAALTSKKFDLAFAVDPLFQRTAAQFDGGGAAGLLLNALPLLGGPCLAFDSTLIPDDVEAEAEEEGGSGGPLEAGPLADAVRAAAAAAAATTPVAPLAALAAAAGAPEDEDDGGADALVRGVLAELEAEGGWDEGEVEGGDAPLVKAEAPEWAAPQPSALALSDGDDDDDGVGAQFGGGAWGDDDGATDAPPTTTPPRSPTDVSASRATGADDALRWLVGGGEGEGQAPATVGKGAWAGAAHWRHRAARARPGAAPVGASADGGAPTPAPPPRPPRRRAEPIDFGRVDPAASAAALRRAPARDTTLRAARARADTLLPDDIHYSPARLARLFLAPECAPAGSGRRAARADDGDDSSDAGAGLGGAGESDEEDEVAAAVDAHPLAAPLAWGGAADAPAPAARPTAAPPVAHARVAKRVDVRALKDALWAQALAASASAGGADLPLATLAAATAASPAGAAAAPPGQLSPHLMFICLLHLCNEHSLELVRMVAGGDGGPADAAAAAVSLGRGADLAVRGVPAA